jgi:acetyl esterase/lipase
MKSSLVIASLSLLVLGGCGRSKDRPAGSGAAPAAGAHGSTARPVNETGAGTPTAGGSSLVEARKGFHTKLVKPAPPKEPVDVPPPNVFSLIKYDSPVGPLAAYLTPDPKNGKKHPAIVWITGGDCNSIGDVWKVAPPDNDQTAAQYRQAGIIMLIPSLRGGNENPGVREGFLGEVDDVLAATDYLAKLPYVDPDRIYLGGHSTGGTLALLVAECSPRFRAVFSFGPADDVSGYGNQQIWTPFAFERKEIELRSPGKWLENIASPTFVIEGTGGNIDSLMAMSRATKNPKVLFIPVRGATHFTVLAPTNQKIAQKIVADTGPQCNITFAANELQPKATGFPKKKNR